MATKKNSTKNIPLVGKVGRSIETRVLKLNLTDEQGELLYTATLNVPTSIKNVHVEGALQDQFATLMHLCECEACGQWYPETTMDEDDLDLFCPDCFAKLNSDEDAEAVSDQMAAEAEQGLDDEERAHKAAEKRAAKQDVGRQRRAKADPRRYGRCRHCGCNRKLATMKYVAEPRDGEVGSDVVLLCEECHEVFQMEYGIN